MSGPPEFDLEQYVNQIRNTIHAAYEAGYSHNRIYAEVESLLFELREEHDPQIETPSALSNELDGLLRNAYVRTDQVIAVLEEKVEELEGIGENADPYGLDELPDGEE